MLTRILHKKKLIFIPCMYHAFDIEKHIPVPGVILMDKGRDNLRILAADEEEYKEHVKFCNENKINPVETWEGWNAEKEIDCDDIFYINGDRFTGGNLFSIFCL